MNRLIIASALMAVSSCAMADYGDHTYNCTSEAGDVVQVTESQFGRSLMRFDGQYVQLTQDFKSVSMGNGRTLKPYSAGYPKTYYFAIMDSKDRIEEVANVSTYIKETGKATIPRSWLAKHSGICSTVKERAVLEQQHKKEIQEEQQKEIQEVKKIFEEAKSREW
ncbi:hypothetical protein LD024_13210 [Citrobacter werkmanii]|uniref:hypothetical protein n=1 Tax=Citrobacter werkmanii TaxID=67827 RepID=UPI001D0B7A9D|nr:hypothetical protein [Citrobacter werkmanii]UBX42935.1 hypothetical protein LD024_13210 [Citrobacter werkmanii]